MKVSMLRSRVGMIAIGGTALAIAFAGGAFWSGASGEAQTPSGLQSNSVELAVDADAAVAAAEAAVADAQRDFDGAMADLGSPYPSRGYRPDPEMQMSERHIIELNEMICKQTGQNCELARMARRQYEEKYGSR